MRYLVAIPSRAGNDGMIVNPSPHRIKEAAKALMKDDVKEVYYITEYTQKMCEMEPKEFDNYVKKNGVKLT